MPLNISKITRARNIFYADFLKGTWKSNLAVKCETVLVWTDPNLSVCCTITKKNFTHLRTRYYFYRNHGVDFWKKVVFGDEKTFCSSTQGASHCWRRKGTRFEKEHLQITHNSGRISKAFWGWCAWGGVGEITVIENRLTGK